MLVSRSAFHAEMQTKLGEIAAQFVLQQITDMHETYMLSQTPV